MKKLLFSAAFACLSLTTWAQAPQKMTYQAVVRNASNNLVGNSSVGIQISILQGSASGVASFIERHTTSTNINGLATIEIGNGSLVAGNFFKY